MKLCSSGGLPSTRFRLLSVKHAFLDCGDVRVRLHCCCSKMEDTVVTTAQRGHMLQLGTMTRFRDIRVRYSSSAAH